MSLATTTINFKVVDETGLPYGNWAYASAYRYTFRRASGGSTTDEAPLNRWNNGVAQGTFNGCSLFSGISFWVQTKDGRYTSKTIDDACNTRELTVVVPRGGQAAIGSAGGFQDIDVPAPSVTIETTISKGEPVVPVDAQTPDTTTTPVGEVLPSTSTPEEAALDYYWYGSATEVPNGVENSSTTTFDPNPSPMTPIISPAAAGLAGGGMGLVLLGLGFLALKGRN